MRPHAALRRAATSVALVAVLALPLGAQENRPLGDQRLDALAASYFDALWKLDPVRATETGVHDYDDKVADESAQGFAERIALVRRTRTQLAAIDPTSYGAESADDAEIFGAKLDEALLRLQTRETWRHDPSLYASDAAQAVYSLVARNFAPPKVRLRDVILRERQLPALLAAGKGNLASVDPVTVEIARRNIAGTIEFFTTVVPAAVAPLIDPASRADFKAANDGTIAALRDYQQSLEAGVFAHPSGTFAIGAKLFERMLALQELTPISLATYERVGEAALARTRPTSSKPQSRSIRRNRRKRSRRRSEPTTRRPTRCSGPQPTTSGGCALSSSRTRSSPSRPEARTSRSCRRRSLRAPRRSRR